MALPERWDEGAVVPPDRFAAFAAQLAALLPAEVEDFLSATVDVPARAIFATRGRCWQS